MKQVWSRKSNTTNEARNTANTRHFANPLQKSIFLVRFGPWSFTQVCSRCKFSHLPLKFLLLFRCSVQPICQPFKKPQKLAHDGHLGSACNFCSKQNLEFPASRTKKIDKAVVWATWTIGSIRHLRLRRIWQKTTRPYSSPCNWNLQQDHHHNRLHS